MTGYVVTRWYRAPEVILNWMHYTQTGEKPRDSGPLLHQPPYFFTGSPVVAVLLGGCRAGMGARRGRGGLDALCPCPLSRCVCVSLPSTLPGPRSPDVGASVSVDIWSVGCIMAEMITGKTLFKGNDRILYLWGADWGWGYPTP